MIGKPKIVIGEMSDQIAACQREHLVAMSFAVAFALLKIKYAHPGIACGVGVRAGSRLGRRAVANDEKLEVAVALPKHSVYRKGKQCRLSMDAQHYRKAGGRHSFLTNLT